MTDSDRVSIGARCSSELVDDFDDYVEANDYASRAEANRDLIKRAVREHRAQQLGVRDVLKHATAYSAGGLLAIGFGSLFALFLVILAGSAVYAEAIGTGDITFGIVVFAVALAGIAMAALLPGMYLMRKARHQAADRVRILERQGQLGATDTNGEVIAE